MHSVVPTSAAPAAKPLALACAMSLSLLCAAAAAADTPADAPSTVVITGARFPSVESLQPIGATVITQDDIRQAGVNDVNSAIRKIGGVFGRQSLDSSPDFTLDLRGFGSNSAQNMVIMVDGVRLNENELANAVLSTIPIDTVERIEINRGGASVLYGEGATGGVIQITTRRNVQPGTHGSVFAEAGRFHEHDVRASLSQTAGDVSADVAVMRQGTQNYRENSGFNQTSASLNLQTRFTGGRVGIHVESARQEQRFPGSLSLEQFEDNPRQSFTKEDYGSLNTDRVNAFAEYRLGQVDLAAELSHRERNVRSNYVSFGSASAYDGTQNQFSPRARWLSDVGGMLNELVGGVDFMRWKRQIASSYSSADASQNSQAVYLRDELRFDPAHDGRIALGVRHENFDKDFSDALAGTVADNGSQSANAWEAQASYRVQPLLDVYAKAGQSYRIANADENGYRYSPDILKPQTSHDLELGATLGDKARQVTARVFRSKLRNEIFYDPTLNNGYGANTNLDPTERKGVEIDGAADLAAGWRASLHAQHVLARFTDGPNRDRDMVLVPKNVLTARLAWTGERQSADIGAQWVDSQRYGGDFSNTCAGRIPSYATFDARYAVRLSGWEVAVNGLNLADRHYFSNAFACRGSIYPSDGRQLKMSARYDF